MTQAEDTSNSWPNLASVRRDYGELSLSETEAKANPIAQFKVWMEEVLQVEKSDPTAMVLSTVDEQGHPDARVVLLKGIDEGAFVFFTNYQSAKAMQLNAHPWAALVFYWPQMARQVRIRGRVKRVTAKQSDDYFSSRPVYSQYSAVISPQSGEIGSRAELEASLNAMIAKHGQKPVARPEYWGGYQLMPEEIEFWQGRDNRLHDRIHYFKQQNEWHRRRLAP